MNTIYKTATIPALAVSAFALIALTGSPVKAATGLAVSNYCLAFGDNETQCGFTTLSQCKESASGLDGECYRDTFTKEGSSGYTPSSPR